MSHRAPTTLEVWWRQVWCSLRHIGRHPLDCDYIRDCDGNHACTECGWTGQ